MLFKRKKARREEDRVWATEALKYEGIYDEIREMSRKGCACIVVAHFTDTIESIAHMMDKKEISCRKVSDTWEMARLDFDNLEPGNVIVLQSELAANPNPSRRRSENQPAKEARIHITVVEHYPTPERDAAVLSFAEKLPPRVTVRFHASLDEPLLVAFGADRTFGLLERLGWEKTGYMSNATITRAIASGQARVKRVAVSDEKVDSQREWFYYNCPILKDRMT